MTRDQALACVPVCNNVLSWKKLENGNIQIEYQLILKPFLVSIFNRFNRTSSARPTRKLELDELGSEVWEMVDGSRNTADLIGQFADNHGLTIQEAEGPVTAFLRELGKRGLIALR